MYDNLLSIFNIGEENSITTEEVAGETYFSLRDVGLFLKIGNPTESKRHLDPSELYKSKDNKNRIFISLKNVFRLIFYSKNSSLNDFVSWLINVLLPFAYDNGFINIGTITDEPEEKKEIVDNDTKEELDDEDYNLLNKELMKHTIYFGHEVLRLDTILMEVADILSKVNEKVPSTEGGNN